MFCDVHHSVGGSTVEVALLMRVVSPCDCWVVHIILNIPMYEEVEGTMCVE